MTIRQRLGKYFDLHSLKLSLAMALGFTCARLMNLPLGGAWVLITLIVVMSDNRTVGALLNKAVLRLLGTLIGAVLGMSTLYFAGNHPLVIIIELVFCGYLLTYLGSVYKEFSYMNTMTLVTLMILLVVPESDFAIAYIRVGEIILGITIAYLISRFFFPIRSIDMFLRELRETLPRIGEFIRLSILQETPNTLADKIYEIDKVILKSIMLQRIYLIHAFTEGKRFRNKKSTYSSLYEAERDLFRIVLTMDTLYRGNLSNIRASSDLQAVKTMLEDVIDLLNFSEDYLAKMEDVREQIDECKSQMVNQMEHAALNELLPRSTLLYMVGRLLETIEAICNNAEFSSLKSTAMCE